MAVKKYDVVAKKTYHVIADVPGEGQRLDIPSYFVNYLYDELQKAFGTKEFHDEFAEWEKSAEGQRLISKYC